LLGDLGEETLVDFKKDFYREHPNEPSLGNKDRARIRGAKGAPSLNRKSRNFYEFLEEGGEFQPQERTSTYQSASGRHGGGEQTRTVHTSHQQKEPLSGD